MATANQAPTRKAASKRTRKSAAGRAAKRDSGKANLELVQSFFVACEALDAEPLGEFFTEDALYHNVPLPIIRGKKQIAAALRTMMRAVTDFEVEMRSIAAVGNTVLTERVDTIVIGGARIDLPVMGAFEIENGKIAAWRDYFDLIQLIRELLAALPRALGGRVGDVFTR